MDYLISSVVSVMANIAAYISVVSVMANIAAYIVTKWIDKHEP